MKWRNLVVWLEDQKVRLYKIEEREELRNFISGDWPKAYQKVNYQLHCEVLGLVCSFYKIKQLLDLVVIFTFNFQYVLIHQSYAWTRGGIKKYILLPLFLLYSAYCECQCVMLRIQTVQKLHSKLCALRSEITLWNCKLCALEDKFIITLAKNMARLRPISNSVFGLVGYGTQNTTFFCIPLVLVW